MEVDHIVRIMVEFGSKGLVLSRRVGSLYRREVKKVGELQGKVDKLEEEKETLEKEKEGWEAERKRLAIWKVRCLDSEDKLNKRIRELEEDYEDLKDKYDGAVGELDDLKNSAAFFHPDVDVSDSRFDVDKDVVDGRLVREDRGDAEEVEEKAAEEEKDAEAAMEGDDNKAT
ncbi:actin-related protein 5-like [Vigna unguiculata]|uniref:actin-related protein 5-like n=1 Tax=Vigna unguiculata TaxID=3917 RepID=UPI001016B173|nr:actin-related protein 5-like [Vigna unguiculata]